MSYTLLTAQGKVLVFTVKACADLYREAYGGVVFTSQVLDQTGTVLVDNPCLS